MRYLQKCLFTFKLKFFCRKRGVIIRKKQPHISCPQLTQRHGSFCTSSQHQRVYNGFVTGFCFCGGCWRQAQHSANELHPQNVQLLPRVTTVHFTCSGCRLQKTRKSTPQNKGAETARVTWELSSNKLPVPCETDTGSFSPDTGIEDIGKSIHL